MKLLSAAIGLLLSATKAWDYAEHGDNWVSQGHTGCNNDNSPQAPIQIPFSLPKREQVYFATDD